MLCASNEMPRKGVAHLSSQFAVWSTARGGIPAQRVSVFIANEVRNRWRFRRAALFEKIVPNGCGKHASDGINITAAATQGCSD